MFMIPVTRGRISPDVNLERIGIRRVPSNKKAFHRP